MEREAVSVDVREIRIGSSWLRRRLGGVLYFSNIMMNLGFQKDKKCPNKFSNCRHFEAVIYILELFIHSMENYDLPGCSHKRENPRGVEKL
jgi:hypothetical protein